MGKRIDCPEFMKCGKDKTGECPACPKGGHKAVVGDRTI